MYFTFLETSNLYLFTRQAPTTWLHSNIVKNHVKSSWFHSINGWSFISIRRRLYILSLKRNASSWILSHFEYLISYRKQCSGQCFLTQISCEISIAMLNLIVTCESIKLRVNLKLSHTELCYLACTENFSVHTEKPNWLR